MGCFVTTGFFFLFYFIFLFSFSPPKLISAKIALIFVKRFGFDGMVFSSGKLRHCGFAPWDGKLSSATWASFALPHASSCSLGPLWGHPNPSLCSGKQIWPTSTPNQELGAAMASAHPLLQDAAGSFSCFTPPGSSLAGVIKLDAEQLSLPCCKESSFSFQSSAAEGFLCMETSCWGYFFLPQTVCGGEDAGVVPTRMWKLESLGKVKLAAKPRG